MTALAPLISSFFRRHLVHERGVSKNTIASYSYAFKFLCRYASAESGKPPSKLLLEDLDISIIRGFLNHLEQNDNNSDLLT